MRVFFLLGIIAALLSGCVTAHIDYSLSDVRRHNASPYRRQSAQIPELNDLRYDDKKSIAATAFNNGAYNRGIKFPKNTADYNEIFCGVKEMSEGGYYIAPDRLYWNPYGPLPDFRSRLAEHLVKADVFGEVIVADGKTPAQYVLELNVKRFITLKERRPYVDGLGILGISALFSSDEIISGEIDWVLKETGSGRVVKKDTAKVQDIQRHNSFRAKKRPFSLADDLAFQLATRIAEQLAAE